MKNGTLFESVDEVYNYYGGNVVKIVNIKQILFYASICKVQPDWIDKSPYDGKIVAYYGKERTLKCWDKWKRNVNSNE